MPFHLAPAVNDPSLETREGDTATAESNHRIANSLMVVGDLLRRQALALARTQGTLTRDAVSGLLLEAAGRVEIVGRLHGRLSRDAVGANRLDDIVRDVAEATFASLAGEGETGLTLRLAAGGAAPAHKTLPIGLVVGELVTNSLKYAHPTGLAGSIEVSCGQDASGALVVEVSDDGVGLPEGYDPATTDGFGLQLVRALAQQMDATLAVVDTGVGLTVRLRMPPQRAASPRDAA